MFTEAGFNHPAILTVESGGTLTVANDITLTRFVVPDDAEASNKLST